jgi:hypothetical protein
MNTGIFKYCVLLIVLFISINLTAQESWWKDKKFKSEKAKSQYEACKMAFIDIGNGFKFKNPATICNYINIDILLNIISFEKGYYTKDQALLILEQFMDYFKIEKFSFQKSYYNNNYAFAIGKYKYNIGEGTRNLNLTVSLNYKNDNWIIDQILIN